MSFESQLNDLAAHVSKNQALVEHEAGTRHALVIPFISALGYDISNPKQVNAEYSADIGTKKGEKVDYAIIDDDGDPIVLIECKKTTGDMGLVSETQLYRYFTATSSVHFGILTNGILYKLYSDLERQNVMDAMPFYETDLTNITESDVKILSRFRRGEFNLMLAIEEAEEMKYVTKIRQIIRRLFDEPDEEFVKWITKQVYNRNFTKEARERFTTLVIRCLREEISERSQRESIPSFAVKNGESPVVNANSTEDLLEDGLLVVHDISNDLIDAPRVTLVHNRDYCSIIVDGMKNSKQVARLHFTDPAKLSIRLYNRDAKHWGPKNLLNSPGNIREYAEPIRNIISAILARDAEKQG